MSIVPTSPPLQIATSAAIREQVLLAQSRGERVGFVPTMGALHEGHLSLVERAHRTCDLVVASIFVNPTQFGPGEDLQAYPRDLDGDLHQLGRRECHLVFVPTVEAMYPPGHTTFVEVGEVARPWEGEHRPGHFRGVATVVLKLLNAVPADQLFLGEKDYQQTLVIKQMVRDLDMPVEVVVCPTVRESDGLAMSSRNAYLSPTDRQRARVLSQSLSRAAEAVRQGQRDAGVLRRKVLEWIAEAGRAEIDYVAFLAEETVREVAVISGPTRLVLAVRIGATRLIDNALVGETIGVRG
jgi:pantoate--beta-alanine ligase